MPPVVVSAIRVPLLPLPAVARFECLSRLSHVFSFAHVSHQPWHDDALRGVSPSPHLALSNLTEEEATAKCHPAAEPSPPPPPGIRNLVWLLADYYAAAAWRKVAVYCVPLDR